METIFGLQNLNDVIKNSLFLTEPISFRLRVTAAFQPLPDYPGGSQCAALRRRKFNYSAGCDNLSR